MNHLKAFQREFRNTTIDIKFMIKLTDIILEMPLLIRFKLQSFCHPRYNLPPNTVNMQHCPGPDLSKERVGMQLLCTTLR